jgi:RNA polymerase sigma factor (sigma-70 family)
MSVGEAASQSPAGSGPDLLRIYLDQAGEAPLLTKAEEVYLAQIIEAGREAAAQLSALSPEIERTPAQQSQQEEWSRQQQEGEAAKTHFVTANLRLVVSIARKYPTDKLALTDLIQEGNLGLMHAVDKFEWRKGFKFSTYASWWIRQAIGRAIEGSDTIRVPAHTGDAMNIVSRSQARLHQELGRLPTPQELATDTSLKVDTVSGVLPLLQRRSMLSLDAPLVEDGEVTLYSSVPDPEANIESQAITPLLHTGMTDILETLDDQEKTVIQLRFGLDRGDPRTLAEVGQAVRLTAETVRRIERVALAKLRHPKHQEALHDFLDNFVEHG